LVRAWLLWTSSALWLYAAALGILAIAQILGPSLTTAYDRGQVAVDLLWATAGVAAVYRGTRRRWASLATAGWICVAVTVVKVLGHDVFELVRPERSLTLLVVGAALLLAACAVCRFIFVPAAAVVLSIPLLAGGALDLARGELLGANADGLA